jgi:hypothetical protein
MKSEDNRYNWQRNDWPRWKYDHNRLAPLLAQAHLAQGHLLGRMHDLGFELRDQATLAILTEYVLKTSEIEGEKLNPDSVHAPDPRTAVWLACGHVSHRAPRRCATLPNYWGAAC